MIHDKFQIINVIFSNELWELAASSGNMATREELDSGAIGAESRFWQAVQTRFNEGFPPGVDGVKFADVVHHNHPLFDAHSETINPGVHGNFTTAELQKSWKELQSEYNTAIMMFGKSGNHYSSFTRVAMVSMKYLSENEDMEGEISSQYKSAYDSEDEADDDDFGMEE